MAPNSTIYVETPRDRIRNLEHHAAILVANNQKSAVIARFDEKAAVERDFQLAAKERELCVMVEDHIANEVERVVILEDSVNQHAAAIKTKTSTVEDVKADLKENKSRFELLVEKADLLMQFQKDTAETTKQHL